ncbi:P-loop containing nucleoside triphosphate hydrolase protein [Chytridium lagenaria]|nr:P-loop containing nucleoside triphosphate hydrolase protein [Chytridium lagenaria]
MRAMARDNFDGDLILRIEDIMGDPPSKNAKLHSVLAEFDQRIGWEPIKKAVRSFVALCDNNYERELQGISPVPVVLNRLFIGSPGTGKTTCGELYGKLLKQLSFLSKGDVVKKTASDFVGSHVGESQCKTNSIIEQARGKVLMIDEAYALDDNFYGKQVLDVIVEKIQGSPYDDIAVVMLGYKENILKMLRDQNPGLTRRFAPDQAFEFEDYKDIELLQIFQYNCEKENVFAPQHVCLRAIEMLSNQRRMPNFGNAGAVETLLRNAIARASTRIKPGDQIELIPEDLGANVEGTDGKSADPYLPLRKMYRVEEIEMRIRRLEAYYDVAKNEGSAVPDLGHFVFTGNPGTGKTTVARVVAKILFNLKIIGTNRLVETTGLGLTAEYIGQTKTRVEEKLKEAKGGCLFIDEAYELGRGHFSTEAVTTLMLDTNPGLKSRFKHYFDFPDWEPKDCVDFLLKKMIDEGYSFTSKEDSVDILLDGIEDLKVLPGWANVRDVLEIWSIMLNNRAVRVQNSPELLRTITLDDTEKAVEAMLSSRKVHSAPRSKSAMNLHPPMAFFSPQPAQATPKIDEAGDKNDTSTRQEEEIGETEMDVDVDDSNVSDRDHGVSDEIWAELARAKEDYKRRMAQIKKDIEDEEKRAALEKMLKQEQKIQENLKVIGLCPEGYRWLHVVGGWRCSAGGHFVSDQVLRDKFSFDV